MYTTQKGRLPGWCLVGLAIATVALTLVPDFVGTAEARGAGHRHYKKTGLSFTYPAAWFLAHNEVSLTSQSNGIVDLSSQPIAVHCRPNTVNGKLTLSGPQDCAPLPPTALEKDGVYVRWTGLGTPGGFVWRQHGKATEVGGLPAKIQVDASTRTCQLMGGQEVITTLVNTAPANFDRINACLRGPQLNSDAREVMAMLQSTRFSGR